MYLGPVGNMQLVVDPDQNLPVSRTRVRGTHQLLSGGRVIDSYSLAKREWQLRWNMLTEAEYAVLAALAEGMYGSFPYAFLDPNQVNLLSPNESSAGETTHDTTGFGIWTTGTIAAVGPSIVTGGRGMYRIQIVAGAASGGLAVGDPTSAATIVATGIPVVPGVTYTGSCLIRSTAGTAQAWRMVLRYYDITGVTNVGNNVGTSTTVTGSFVQRVTPAAAAPAGAALMIPTIEVPAWAAANTVEVEDLQVAQGSSTLWSPGLDMPRIGQFDLDDSYPWIGYHGPVTATLQEL